MSQNKEQAPDLGHEEIKEILKHGTDLREYSQEIEKELIKVKRFKVVFSLLLKLMLTFIRSQMNPSRHTLKSPQTLLNCITKLDLVIRFLRTWKICFRIFN